MTVSVKHAFVSAKAEGADATQVRTSNWNAEHVITMSPSKILGRDTAGVGAVEELTAGEGLQINSLNLRFWIPTMVSGGVPWVTGGINEIPVWNSANGHARINFSDMVTQQGLVKDTRRVEAGNGLENGASGAALNSDVTIHMRTPGTLNSSSTNDPNGAHTHEVNETNIAANGTAGLAENGLGTYALARQNGGGAAKTLGETITGSNLSFASAAAGGGAATGNGTWRCMGRVTGDTATNNNTNITLWLRIS